MQRPMSDVLTVAARSEGETTAWFPPQDSSIRQKPLDKLGDTSRFPQLSPGQKIPFPQEERAAESCIRKPSWIRRPISLHGQWETAKALVKELKLHTVCEEARCPNLGECWSHGNVSFLILGDRCTRRCAFCAVTTARPEAWDPQEAQRLAEAVIRLGLRYVVVTSVARDDLPDEGSGAFAETIRAIKNRSLGIQVEVLTPDFHAKIKLIGKVVEADPEVYNHNVETVERLTHSVRPQADYHRSLEVLRIARELGGPDLKTKSGLMVGLGEEEGEIRQTMVDLRRVGCDILTIGQYLQPTVHHRPVTAYVSPERFQRYRQWARELGFTSVASGPYVRSSYRGSQVLQNSLEGHFKDA